MKNNNFYCDADDLIYLLTNEMVTGKLKYWYNGEYGFLSIDGRKSDAFFYWSDVQYPNDILQKDDPVKFKLERSKKGCYRARCVVKLQKPLGV